VIVKIPTQNPEVRAMLDPARVYERETRFYQQLAARPAVAAPRCWFAGMDDTAREHVLLLEDLAGFRNGDQAVACSVADAHAALAALGAFHAAFWNDDSVAGLEWLPPINAEINKATGEAVYAKSLPGFLDVFGRVLTPETMAMAQRYGSNVRQLLDRLEALPNTVVHFDFRLDNLFFDGPSDAPVRLIDFQAVARGGGAYDVGYFLSQSLDIEDRRAHEGELLDTYLDALAAHGVTGYGREQLQDDLRVGIIYSWIIPVMAVGGGFDLSDERAMRLWDTVVARCQAAIADHRAAELLD
jgi:aminoglycoside/choline kinase family phosphotransferase